MTSSKTLIADIEVNVRAILKAGIKRGNIIFINICILLAPSILAASYMVSGIALIDDKNTIEQNGIFRQATIKDTIRIKEYLFDKYCIGSSIIFKLYKILLRKPYPG